MSAVIAEWAYNIARTCSKGLKKRKTLYATGPIVDGETAYVQVTTADGRLYRVTVKCMDDMDIDELYGLSEDDVARIAAQPDEED